MDSNWFWSLITVGSPNPAGYEACRRWHLAQPYRVILPRNYVRNNGGTTPCVSWLLMIGTPLVILTMSASMEITRTLPSRLPSLLVLNLTWNRSILCSLTPGDTRILPLYVRFDGPISDEIVEQFQAHLGELKSYSCSHQGFEDRSVCMIHIPEGMEGTEVPFKLTWGDCQPIYELPAVLIPVPKPVAPTCSADLSAEDCKKVGGSYQLVGRVYQCVCP